MMGTVRKRIFKGGVAGEGKTGAPPSVPRLLAPPASSPKQQGRLDFREYYVLRPDGDRWGVSGPFHTFAAAAESSELVAGSFVVGRL